MAAPLVAAGISAAKTIAMSVAAEAAISAGKAALDTAQKAINEKAQDTAKSATNSLLDKFGFGSINKQAAAQNELITAEANNALYKSKDDGFLLGEEKELLNLAQKDNTKTQTKNSMKVRKI